MMYVCSLTDSLILIEYLAYRIVIVRGYERGTWEDLPKVLHDETLINS